MRTNPKMNALFHTRSRCFLLNPIQVKGNLTTSVVNYALIVRGFCQSCLEIDCYQFSPGETEVLIELITNHKTQTLNASVRDGKALQTNNILTYRIKPNTARTVRVLYGDVTGFAKVSPLM